MKKLSIEEQLERLKKIKRGWAITTIPMELLSKDFIKILSKPDEEGYIIIEINRILNG